MNKKWSLKMICHNYVLVIKLKLSWDLSEFYLSTNKLNAYNMNNIISYHMITRFKKSEPQLYWISFKSFATLELNLWLQLITIHQDNENYVNLCMCNLYLSQLLEWNWNFHRHWLIKASNDEYVNYTVLRTLVGLQRAPCTCQLKV